MNGVGVSLMDAGAQGAAELEIECDAPSTGRCYRDDGMHLCTFNDADKAICLCYYRDSAKRIHTTELL